MVAVADSSRKNKILHPWQSFRLLPLALVAVCTSEMSFSRGQEVPVAGFVPGTGTRADVKPFYFAVPAPRGQILDRKGRPLAQNTTVRRLQLTVPAAQRSTLETYTAWLEKTLVELTKDVPAARMPDAAQLQRHYEDRRELPVTVSDVLPSETVLDPQKHLHSNVRTEYVRHYPQGDMAAHLLGYVSSEGAPPAGPILRNEPLWQRTSGAAGLEAAFNKQLTGTDGTLCVMMADAGTVAYEQVFTAPEGGRDVVTTLNLDTQRAAETALNQSGKRGAIVIIDAHTGDIRAMASNPRFDPNAFAQGISSSDFAALTQNIDGPLFDRAVQGSYPPGSVFKPIVVMAGLRAATVDALRVFECGPTLMIDGREFDNWSKDDHGWFDARAAIIRSCNTYFYQSAMVTRDMPILYMAHEFGFGQAPVLPLKASAGSLPKRAPSNHDLANLSIGQGVTEASPLQMAMAMATIANGACRPRPRLVMQTQSQSGQVGDVTSPARETLIPVSDVDLETVRHAMFGVVNHVNGTGKAARLKNVPVFGKTGTAQWVLRGAKANVVWFAGYMGTTPPLAFTVTIEGNAGQSGLSGGGTAAPVIAKVLRDIQERPAVHGVSYEKGKVTEETDPLTAPVTPAFMYGAPPPQPVREGLFSRLFR
ncbi:MAG: peptidoglycan D,D-transpeptidase FtsI family protein [Prosthecobacter sp.]|uniref:peptidoglycan D,D-transpeptidase FtsI family protein n=1 Tax=Prosthecobacter sp. TaxID=1965333 RepID=UPI0038FF29C5